MTLDFFMFFNRPAKTDVLCRILLFNITVLSLMLMNFYPLKITFTRNLLLFNCIWFSGNLRTLCDIIEELQLKKNRQKFWADKVTQATFLYLVSCRV